MSASEDITNLFRKFGGDPEHYQEMSRENAAQESKARWPLLSSVHLSGNVFAPSVKDGVPPELSAPVPNLQGHAPVQTSVSPFAAQVASALSSEAQANVAANAAAGSLDHGVSRANTVRAVSSVGNTLFKTRAAVRAERRSDAGGMLTHARHATGVGGLGGQGDSRRGGIQTNRLAAQVSSTPHTALRFEPHLRDDEREHGVPPLNHADAARDLDGELFVPSQRSATLGQAMRRFAKDDAGHAGAAGNAPGDHQLAGSAISRSMKRTSSGTMGGVTSRVASKATRHAASHGASQGPSLALSHASAVSRSLQALRASSSVASAEPMDEAEHTEPTEQIAAETEQTADQRHVTSMPDVARMRNATAPRSLSSVFSRLAGPSAETDPVADASPATAPTSRNPLFARLSRL